jgi:uridine phosphorylase
MGKIPETELILNQDGSVYHLNLLPGDIAPVVFMVGDPDRVSLVSSHFDKITIKKQRREFITHTGTFKNVPVTVISSGIGTDNIDIVMNELDALVNVDLKSREEKSERTSLKLIRLGTCGALHADIPPDARIFSTHGLGLDGLLHFYKYENTAKEEIMLTIFKGFYTAYTRSADPYLFACSPFFEKLFQKETYKGITATCSGFYGPQGRSIRAKLHHELLPETLNSFSFDGCRIANFEMETAAIYGMSRILGHDAASLNIVVANRITKAFSRGYNPAVDEMIRYALEKVTAAV